MKPRLLFASTLLFACTSKPTAPPPTPPPAAPPPVAATPPPAPVDPPPPPVDTAPPAGGDSLTLARHACYGTCPVYTLTLHTSGRVEWRGEAHVTRPGPLTAAIDPAVVRELLAAGEQLDLDHLPPDREKAACGNDLPATSLTLRRGEATRTVVVDASCLVSFCDDRGKRCSDGGLAKDLAKRGLSRKAMSAAEALARRIDAAVPTTSWVDDPDCRELPVIIIPHGIPDDRDPGHTRAIEALRADPGAAVKISSMRHGNVDAELAAHRDRLIARGVAASRIHVHVRRDWQEPPTVEAVALQVGPGKCFGAPAPAP